MKKNKLVRISLSGGIIGLLATNPRIALENSIEKHNNESWNAHQVIPHSTTNILVKVLQLIVLACTCGIWTWGAGYIVLLEKESN